MALETVSTIYDLVASNPTAGDPLSQADDHLRNIKTALLSSFAFTTGVQDSYKIGSMIVKIGGGLTASDGTATITYTTPFPSAVRFVIPALQASVVDTRVFLNSNAGTVSSFPVFACTTTGSPMGVSFIWLAIGR